MTLRIFIAGKQRRAIAIDPDRIEDAVSRARAALAEVLDFRSVAVFVETLVSNKRAEIAASRPWWKFF